MVFNYLGGLMNITRGCGNMAPSFLKGEKNEYKRG
jgi:hypothetical protein